jgi:hypothetical protein
MGKWIGAEGSVIRSAAAPVSRGSIRHAMNAAPKFMFAYANAAEFFLNCIAGKRVPNDDQLPSLHLSIEKK